MNVLISTVPRSGSTLLFNICRLLFEHVYGINETYATWCQFHKESNEKKYNVIKIHERNTRYTNWSHKIITSVRDIRYIMASYADFNKKFNINDPNNMRSVCKSFIKMMENNCSVADYVFRYEEFSTNPSKVVYDIAKCLELPLNDINTDQILKEIEKIKKTKYNKLDREKTQMHPNHISPKSDAHITERMTIEQLNFIESNFSWFFEKYGYATTSLIKML